jgi:N-acyl homoserine lactone hydrolase
MNNKTSKKEIIPLFIGFPGRSARGFLGWSSTYLIQIHNEGKVKNYLFDTAGYNERIELFNRLEDLNLNKNDIDGLILSHLHFDHAVNWTLFPNSKIYIHKKELSAPQEYDFAVPDFHQQELLQCPNLQFIAENDEIDGIRVIEVPGHTAGMIALDIDKKILASDSIKNRLELIHGPLGNTWDVEIAKKSIQKIAGIAEVIYPGHDVPLIKENGKWVATAEAEETIILAEGLCCGNGTNKLTISVPDC